MDGLNEYNCVELLKENFELSEVEQLVRFIDKNPKAVFRYARFKMAERQVKLGDLEEARKEQARRDEFNKSILGNVDPKKVSNGYTYERDMKSIPLEKIIPVEYVAGIDTYDKGQKGEGSIGIYKKHPDGGLEKI